MALFGDAFKGNVVTGLAIGIGAAVLAPMLMPAAARMGRPMMKNLIKTGLTLIERGRETLAELSEVAEDLVAEAEAELAAEHFDGGASPAADSAVATVRRGSRRASGEAASEIAGGEPAGRSARTVN